MIPLAILAALAVVFSTGGRFHRVTDFDLRWRGLVLLASGLQVLALLVIPGAPRPLLVALHLLSYALAAAVVLINRRIRGVVLIGLGGLLNLAAIVCNGGVMPASDEAARTAGLSAPAASQFVNSRVMENPKLLFLGDVLALPKSWPLHNVFSIGDVLIVVGAAVLLYTMSRRGEAPVASFGVAE